MILKALVFRPDEKPENNFYTRFYTDISSLEMSEFLLFYPVANLPIKKVCIIKNFEEAEFTDFEQTLSDFKWIWKLTNF